MEIMQKPRGVIRPELFGSVAACCYLLCCAGDVFPAPVVPGAGVGVWTVPDVALPFVRVVPTAEPGVVVLVPLFETAVVPRNVSP